MIESDKVFEHLMLDIETMGNESYSAITSIGAVEFDINTGETGLEFYSRISLQSSVNLGLVMNVSTVLWWMRQNEEARGEFTRDDEIVCDIERGLSLFSEFCDDKYQVWGNSARFDCGILQNAYNKAGIDIPWDFRNERCLRTLVSFAPEVKKNHKYLGDLHNALDDCYNQIGYCVATWNEVNKEL